MSASDAAGMTGIVWRRIDPAHEAEGEGLMRQLMALSRRSPGFLGSEIFPPIAGVQDAYVVLYRFNSALNLRRWLESPERQAIFQQLALLLLEPAKEFFFAHRRQEAGTVSTVFSYRVRLGSEDKFREWRTRIFEASRQWPGYVGTESFDTLDSSHPEFVVVVRFDTRPHLDAWLHCAERAALIDEVHHYVENYEVRRIGTGFEGWFEYGNDTRPPIKWRQGVLVLATLFPVIMILRYFMTPLFKDLPFPVAFLILLTADVAILTYIIMPYFSRAMTFWLKPKPGPRGLTELAGWAILFGLIAVTLAITLTFGD